MAFLVFLQNFGTSIVVVLSNTIFAQTLTSKISHYAPSVTPQAALEAGSDSNAIRHLVDGHEGELNGVLKTYSQGLQNIFYLLIGISSISVVFCLGMGWVDVRKKQEAERVTAKDEGVRNEKSKDEENNLV